MPLTGNEGRVLPVDVLIEAIRQAGRQGIPAAERPSDIPLSRGVLRGTVRVQTIDLTNARDDELIHASGMFVWMADGSSSGGRLDIRFNDRRSDRVPFYRGSAFSGINFDKLLISNDAQEGRTLTMVTGNVDAFFAIENAGFLSALDLSNISTLDRRHFIGRTGVDIVVLTSVNGFGQLHNKANSGVNLVVYKIRLQLGADEDALVSVGDATLLEWILRRHTIALGAVNGTSTNYFSSEPASAAVELRRDNAASGATDELTLGRVRAQSGILDRNGLIFDEECTPLIVPPGDSLIVDLETDDTTRSDVLVDFRWQEIDL